MGKRKVTPGTLCAYCGIVVGMDGTEDHVIPRGLFPKTRRRNLVKVPTCRPCNDAKARHDDYLRDWLLSSLDPDDSTTPREVYDAFLRAAGRKQSDVAQAAMQYGRLVPVFAESGLCTGFGHAYPLEGDRVQQLGEWIAKGLYHDLHGHPLPAQAVVGFHLLLNEKARQQAAILRGMGASVTHVMGDGECVVLHVEGRDGGRLATFALVILYNIVALGVSTRYEPESA